MRAKVNSNLRRIRLTVLFMGMIFVIILITVLITFMGMVFLHRLGILNNPNPLVPVGMFAFASLIVGTIVAAIISSVPLTPIRKVIEVTDRIANGDYSVRIHLSGPDEFRLLGEKFNHMAEELGSVEMLRKDFINNFSHEFKTPIVSIRGFAKILKYDDLTEEERTEYLDTIINESERLTDLAANVLNLSKIEQQNILTDRKKFNISEQIRLVIALLEGKWIEKNIDFDFDCEEWFFTGNEEMMKQVWINLLDNAIKFSPQDGTVTIRINKTDYGLSVTIQDQGIGISDEALPHIFDKFYQGDLSHVTKGNGLGLAIAHRIVTLHDSSLTVKSTGKNGTVFEVKLTCCAS